MDGLPVIFWIRKILLRKVNKLGPVPECISSTAESTTITTMLKG